MTSADYYFDSYAHFGMSKYTICLVAACLVAFKRDVLRVTIFVALASSWKVWLYTLRWNNAILKTYNWPHSRESPVRNRLYCFNHIISFDLHRTDSNLNGFSFQAFMRFDRCQNVTGTCLHCVYSSLPSPLLLCRKCSRMRCARLATVTPSSTTRFSQWYLCICVTWSWNIVSVYKFCFLTA